MEHSCIKEKRFLFWKYKVVEHDYKIWRIGKFMWCSKKFEVTWKCTICKTPKDRHFVEYDELILEGLSSEILNNVSEFNAYYNE